MQHIKAVCLDLDDTLWDLTPVIVRAELATYRWLDKNYPRVTGQFTLKKMRELRYTVALEYPEYAHDLSFLRKETLARLAREASYSEEMVDSAFARFQQARNDVTLFDDVLPALQSLIRTHELYALTNGNADLEVIGLAGFFSHVITAAGIGAAKPDLKAFHSVCGLAGKPARQIAHVGDDPWKDVAPAKAAGMTSIWINRTGATWPDDLQEPDHEVQNLTELVVLIGK